MQTHVKSCDFLHVPCANPECGMMVKKSAMREHEKNECKGRLQKCDYCKKDVKLNLMKVGLIASSFRLNSTSQHCQ